MKGGGGCDFPSTRAAQGGTEGGDVTGPVFETSGVGANGFQPKIGDLVT